MVKAITVDMDGTFLDSKKNYDKDRFEKIFKSIERTQYKFIAASGNQFAKLQSIFGERDMFFISENGFSYLEVKIYIIIVASIKQTTKEVVDYLNIDRNIKEFIYCLRIKECLYIERHE